MGVYEEWDSQKSKYKATEDYKKMLEYETVFVNYRRSYEKCLQVFASFDETFNEEECGWFLKAVEYFPDIDFSRIHVMASNQSAYHPHKKTVCISKAKSFDVIDHMHYFFYVVCHEFRHIDQHIKKHLRQEGMTVKWETENETFAMTLADLFTLHDWRNPELIVQYQALPWEADANNHAMSCLVENNIDPREMRTGKCSFIYKTAIHYAKKGY